MNLVLIGTDHRLQNSVARDEETNAWVPRDGGHRYRKLLAHCIEKLGVKVIVEEAHPTQEQIVPTIASETAKAHGLPWHCLGLGEPGFEDGLLDPPFPEAFRLRVKPEVLAGIYNLQTHRVREQFMYEKTMDALRQYDNVLAIVGYIHLGVLARMFEEDTIPVHALVFMYPLVVDETKS